MIMGLQATSPAFADAEPFPPLPVAAGATPPAGACALDFFISFESSGKWPDDLGAIAHLRTAFYLRLAALLEEQHKLLCEVRHEALYVQHDGFTFRAMIHHEREISLLEEQKDELGARALKWRTTSGGTHTASISALARTHPALAPSIRLAKRWLACQLYTGEVPPSLVELLTAATFASAGERAPCSAVCGFANFLHLLASYDFEHEPLLFGFDGAITEEHREVAEAAFTKQRDADTADAIADDRVFIPPLAIWIATDHELGGAAGCAAGPTTASVHRLRALASAALAHLDRACLIDPPALLSAAAGVDTTAAVAQGHAAAPKDAAAAAAAALDRTTRAVVCRAFDPPSNDFDALLELGAAKLPCAHLSWQPGVAVSKGREPKAASAYANLRRGEIAAGIGDDPVAALVAALEGAYGSLALFFYDGLGGRVIAIKWKPAAFLPSSLRAPTAQHRMLVRQSGAATDDAEAATWAMPNVADALAGMVQLGGGLIKSVRMPQTGHALRQ